MGFAVWHGSSPAPCGGEPTARALSAAFCGEFTAGKTPCESGVAVFTSSMGGTDGYGAPASLTLAATERQEG